MLARLSFSLYDIRDSLWFRPALMTLAAVALAFLMLWIDQRAAGGPEVQAWWLFEGSATGARGVLSAIATTMMTVVTTAFSITMVTLQLGSSQYSPRILRNFTGDRGNQMVLGVFIATFVYCLLVLRAVRSEAEDATEFVPSLSISVALLLALICIGSLIYFLHHATRTIQASVILHSAANDVAGLTDRHFEAADRRLDERTITLQDRLPVVSEVAAKTPGYIRGVQDGLLKSLAVEHDLLITVRRRVGDFVFTGSDMVTIQRFTGARPDEDNEGDGNGPLHELRKAVGGALETDTSADATDHDEDAAETGSEDEIEQLIDRVRGTFTLGLERTLNEDILFGFQQLTDIGMRSLSPGINDPTTAMLCIDQLGEALIRVRETNDRATVVVDDEGTPRVMYPPIPFALFLASMQHMRHFAATDPFVSVHLVGVLKEVWSASEDADTRQALEQEARTVADAVAAQEPLPIDLQAVRVAAGWAYGA